MQKRFKKIMTVCAVICVILSLTGCVKKSEIRLEDAAVSAENTEDPKTQTEEPKKSDAQKIYVYICGEVKHPGVYELERDGRIYQLVEQAGGFTKQADQTAVNLAQTLEDGQMVEILKKQKSSDQVLADGSNATQLPSSGTDTGKTPDGRVNINTATREQLMSLSGIGASKAERILEYREKNGSFQKTEDLMKVEGIKEGTFEKIKDSISVQ